MEKSEYIQLNVMDELHTIKLSDINPNTTLNNYLRKTLNSTGTKYMCKEGGCGACIVGVIFHHPVTNEKVTVSVNSCLIPLIMCENWKILTVEGIGNKASGFHPIQKSLAQYNGTQCGFCSPGMVMNMYTLLQANKNITMKEMENSFGGNLCRCTGYRPIITAFKTLCSDKDNLQLPEKDIEDLQFCPNKTKSGNCQEIQCSKNCKKLMRFEFEHSSWYKAFTLDEIFEIWKQNPTKTYSLISGNTSQGVYRTTTPLDLYIDITSVPKLVSYEITDKKIILGANLSLNNTISIFKDVSSKKVDYKYLDKLADHIDLIANVPVRNIGSLAGNISIKHAHKEFPSDICLLLTAVNAEITVAISNTGDQNLRIYFGSFIKSQSSSEITMSLEDYLKFDMKRKVITKISFFPYNSDYKFESYKIMPRAQNAHALVNAAFLFKLSKDNKVEKATMTYGNINPTFMRANKTENYLIGKNLFDNTVLQEAYKILEGEIQPDEVLPNPSAKFRKNLAISLFYKFVLSICPEELLNKRHKSGGNKLLRQLSSGKQEFKTDSDMFPLGKPLQKLEALSQTSGVAEYINDIPDQPHQLYASFVLVNCPANSKILDVDTSKALNIKGVIGYFDKTKIPGRNTFTPKEGGFGIEETLFCDGIVQYYHQPIGIIVANNEDIANQAAKLVVIKHEEGAKPLLTVKDVLNSDEETKKSKIIHVRNHDRVKKGSEVKKVLKGTFNLGAQYHFHMETQICNVIPIEDGLDIITSTQFMDHNQVAAAIALNIPASKINISVRRLGGGFGAKLTRNAMLSTVCAIAAFHLQKPVKMILPLSENIKMFGGRGPMYMNYEVGINEKGVIQYLNADYYNDYGCGGNDFVVGYCWEAFNLKYIIDTWQISLNTINTDNAARCWFRGPGSTEGFAAIESIIEHISMSENLPSNEIRLAIFNNNMNELKMLINEFMNWADIKNRLMEIENFNKNNRWMKKGLSVVPSLFKINFFGNWSVMVCINHGDGTVAVSHGGIEMGQGINTKVAQACAHTLGISMEKISIKPTNNLVSCNSAMSGGSITSESMCYGVVKACEILNKRINDVRKTMPAAASWEKVVQKCFSQNVELISTYMFSPKNDDIQNYVVNGVGATEVLVDVLTGNHLITRVDIQEDTGFSLNPNIDIGQIEGAFVMGQGYYTTEQIIQSDKGNVLTDSTWTYKVPGMKDIPIDFRIKLPDTVPNELGVLHTKAVGEPPLVLSVSIPFALRQAIASARSESDINAEKWVPMDGPTTVDFTFENCLNKPNDYLL